jgi:hypothetical protein
VTVPGNLADDADDADDAENAEDAEETGLRTGSEPGRVAEGARASEAGARQARAAGRRKSNRVRWDLLYRISIVTLSAGS